MGDRIQFALPDPWHLFDYLITTLMKKRKIIIAGGTGFIGKELIRLWVHDDIVVLTRNLKNVQTNSYDHEYRVEGLDNVKYVLWNAKDKGDWTSELEAADIIINLCGKSVNCRYTTENKRRILSSRTEPTQALGTAIQKCIDPPKLWINASSATIYRHAEDRPQDEYNGDIENDFSVQVCKAWEKSFFDIRTPFTRKVALRAAVTLGRGSVLVPYFNLLKFGLGGQQGSGEQMYSWIHVKDIYNIINWIFDHKEMEGVYNAAAPHPVTNKAFMRLLRNATGHKFGLPAYEWMLKLGAICIGTETELVLKSRWVLPTKLLASGFNFEYPTLDTAFSEIVNRTPRKAYHLF
jgi:uncharacterized protein (TIGR01777 family)